MNSFAKLTKKFEEALFRRLEQEKDTGLFEQMSYALSGGGKRIRPLLAALAAEALGKSFSDVLPIAIAVELIHNYSLIHDDLPAMDNDDLRRGRPTLHKKFGEGIAVLTGDALLNLAYEVLLENLESRNSGYAKGIAIIASFAGVRGMVGGQCTDISGKKLDEDEYITLYSKKTSALLQAAAVSAACALSATPDIIAAFSEYAYYLGLAFQIQDDLIEYKERGNVPSRDYVSVVGAAKAREACVIYTEKSVEALKPLENKDNLIKFAHLLLVRSH